MSDSRRVYLPWGFHAETALCSAGVLYRIIMKHAPVLFCTDLCGETPGEMRKPQQVKVAESRSTDSARSKDFSVGYFVFSGFRHFRLQGEKVESE